MAERKLKFNKYGWRPDKPDKRDFKYSVPRHLTGVTLPPEIDLSSRCPAPYDQQTLGSCTGQAIGGAAHFNLIKQNPAKAFQPSAMFIYYNERLLENTVNEDAGAEIRSGIKSLVRWGICPEQYHPYIISKFKIKPTKFAYNSAMPHRIDKYMRVRRSEKEIKACLADEHPVVFGMTVYESFESEEVAKTGVVHMPGVKEDALGGHAVLAVGYNDHKREFKVRNSWGYNWGNQGYFSLPYDYLLDEDLSDDFWVINWIPND